MAQQSNSHNAPYSLVVKTNTVKYSSLCLWEIWNSVLQSGCPSHSTQMVQLNTVCTCGRGISCRDVNEAKSEAKA